MSGGGSIGRAWLAPLLALTLLCAPASKAAADSLAVQPDGKILLFSTTDPQFGAVVRLNPDGSLDRSFGRDGFLLDHRAPSFAALALQPDGRIVAGGAGGSVLARYLPDGLADPSFDGDGIGGTPEPGQSHSVFSHPYEETSPVEVVVQPGGAIAMAESPSPYPEVGSEARVRRYSSQGEFLETAGRVPRGSSVALAGLAEGPDGSLVGAGWASVREKGGGGGVRPLLARFLPGSGLDFDHSFGDGFAVRPSLGQTKGLRNRFEAIAATGDKLLVAGQIEKRFLLARFDRAGNLDPSFGEGGFAAPKIVGPAEGAVGDSWQQPSSWAHDLDVAGDGDIVIGGGTTQWGKWYFEKVLPRCQECTQPMLARFDSSGHLDPGFGDGGLRRLAMPDGKVFEGQIDQVVALADGKILVGGRMIPGEWARQPPFVARLQADGSYDAGFGSGGLVTPEFPCTVQSLAQRERDGC